MGVRRMYPGRITVEGADEECAVYDRMGRMVRNESLPAGWRSSGVPRPLANSTDKDRVATTWPLCLHMLTLSSPRLVHLSLTSNANRDNFSNSLASMRESGTRLPLGFY